MAHGNTIFHQMLKLIPRHLLGKLDEIENLINVVKVLRFTNDTMQKIDAT